MVLAILKCYIVESAHISGCSSSGDSGLPRPWQKAMQCLRTRDGLLLILDTFYQQIMQSLTAIQNEFLNILSRQHTRGSID